MRLPCKPHLLRAEDLMYLVVWGGKRAAIVVWKKKAYMHQIQIKKINLCFFHWFFLIFFYFNHLFSFCFHFVFVLFSFCFHFVFILFFIPISHHDGRQLSQLSDCPHCVSFGPVSPCLFLDACLNFWWVASFQIPFCIFAGFHDNVCPNFMGKKHDLFQRKIFVNAWFSNASDAIQRV